MMRYQKAFMCMLFMMTILLIPIHAEESYEKQVQDALSELIPKEVEDAAGGMDALFTEDGAEKLGVGFVLQAAGQALGSALKPALRNFVLLFGIVLVVGAACMLKNSRSEPIVSLICTLVTALASYSLLTEQMEAVALLIDYLNRFMTAMLGVMGVLWTVSGSAASAALTGSSMMLTLTVLENIVDLVLMPLLMLCFALALVSAVSGELRGITAFIRNVFSTILGFLMMLLMTVLGSQNAITQSADSNLMRTIRFAAGTFIPVVGGAVSEAARTIAGGVGMLKSITGTIGVVILLVVTLPVIISLFLNRAAFHLAAESAKLLGIDGASGFLSEIKSLFDLAIGLTCAFFMMFTFSMILFAHSRVAV